MLIRKINIGLALVVSTLLLCSFADSHDLDMALFVFNLQEDKSTLSINIDKEDFQTAVYQHINREINNTPFSQLAKSYIEVHVKLSVNHEQAQYDKLIISEKKDHYMFTLEIIACSFPITSMVIKNTCLTEEIDGQNNVVTVKYKNKRRDFRMHQERSEIQLEF